MKNVHGEMADMPGPEPGGHPHRKRRHDDSEEMALRTNEPEFFDADALLPGAVFMVPNRHWGFEVVSATDHPGACTQYKPGAKDAILVKGTDADHVRNPRGYFFTEPSTENGLQKRTAFELVPRPFRMHRLKLYFPERHIGRLEEVVLQSLRTELARVHPEE